MAVEKQIEQNPQDPAELNVAQMVVAEALEMAPEPMEVVQPLEEAPAMGIAAIPLEVAIQVHEEQAAALEIEVQPLNLAAQPLDEAVAPLEVEAIAPPQDGMIPPQDEAAVPAELQPDEIIWAEIDPESEEVVLPEVEPSFLEVSPAEEHQPQEVSELHLQEVSEVEESLLETEGAAESSGCETPAKLKNLAAKTNAEMLIRLLEEVAKLTQQLQKTLSKLRNPNEYAMTVQGQDLAAAATAVTEIQDIAEAVAQSQDLATVATELKTRIVATALLKNTVEETSHFFSSPNVKYQEGAEKAPTLEEKVAYDLSSLHISQSHEEARQFIEETAATVDILEVPDISETIESASALLQNRVEKTIQMYKKALATVKSQNGAERTPALDNNSAKDSSLLQQTSELAKNARQLMSESVATVEFLEVSDMMETVEIPPVEIATAVETIETGSALETLDCMSTVETHEGSPAYQAAKPILQRLEELNKVKQLVDLYSLFKRLDLHQQQREQRYQQSQQLVQNTIKLLHKQQSEQLKLPKLKPEKLNQMKLEHQQEREDLYRQLQVINDQNVQQLHQQIEQLKLIQEIQQKMHQLINQEEQ